MNKLGMIALKPTHFFKHFMSTLPYNTYSSSNYLNNQLNFLFATQIPKTLKAILHSHSLIITTGNSSNPFIASKLISLYASLHDPTSSTKVFNSIIPKDTFLWNSIIKSHFSNGQYSQALDFYLQMRAFNILPNHFTVPMIVATCSELALPDHGKVVHGLASKLGLFTGNSAIGSSFVYMYAKFRQMVEACNVFDEIVIRDVVAWTALVIGYVQNGESKKGLECLCMMHRIGEDDEKPNFRTLEGGFQACGNFGGLFEGRCLHGLVVKTGLRCAQVVQSSLLSMYSKCGTPEEAYLSFCEVVEKDLLSWTSVIGVHARFGFMTECLRLFLEMQDGDIYPDGILISCMLLGFGNSMSVYEGKAFHGLIIRRHYVFDQMVHNALLSMFCKFGLLILAEKLFDRAHKWDKESWNTLISGYGQIGMGAKCIKLFREMLHLGLEYDSNSLASVISSCSQVGATYLGRSLHCYTIKILMEGNVLVDNSLIDMYGKSGNLAIAHRIFYRSHRDMVTWNTLISIYARNGHSAVAVALFDKMMLENLKPNAGTLVTVLSACSQLASLEKGERVHQYIKEGGFEFNLSLVTALVDMYAKCGQLEKSRQLFNSMKEMDVISWNVMISGYAMHGEAKSAIEVFHLMEKSNDKPNGITFLALLSACTHAGLVEEGKYLFGRMHDYFLKPNLKHYTCMVDLLGRSGNLQEAEALVLSMPISPDGGVWGTLLSACKIHNEIDMAARIAKHAIESDPINDGYYILISNMYSSTGRWEQAETLRKMMKERGVEKRAGWSAV